MNALKLLGTLAFQSGESQLSIELISQSIAINPGHAEADCNLGLALHESGKLERAINCYQQVNWFM